MSIIHLKYLFSTNSTAPLLTTSTPEIISCMHLTSLTLNSYQLRPVALAVEPNCQVSIFVTLKLLVIDCKGVLVFAFLSNFSLSLYSLELLAVLSRTVSLIISGIEVGTEKCRAHMIKDISGYPAWHR